MKTLFFLWLYLIIFPEIYYTTEDVQFSNLETLNELESMFKKVEGWENIFKFLGEEMDEKIQPEMNLKIEKVKMKKKERMKHIFDTFQYFLTIYDEKLDENKNLKEFPPIDLFADNVDGKQQLMNKIIKARNEESTMQIEKIIKQLMTKYTQDPSKSTPLKDLKYILKKLKKLDTQLNEIVTKKEHILTYDEIEPTIRFYEDKKPAIFFNNKQFEETIMLKINKHSVLLGLNRMVVQIFEENALRDPPTDFTHHAILLSMERGRAKYYLIHRKIKDYNGVHQMINFGQIPGDTPYILKNETMENGKRKYAFWILNFREPGRKYCPLFFKSSTSYYCGYYRNFRKSNHQVITVQEMFKLSYNRKQDGDSKKLWTRIQEGNPFNVDCQNPWKFEEDVQLRKRIRQRRKQFNLAKERSEKMEGKEKEGTLWDFLHLATQQTENHTDLVVKDMLMPIVFSDEGETDKSTSEYEFAKLLKKSLDEGKHSRGRRRNENQEEQELYPWTVNDAKQSAKHAEKFWNIFFILINSLPFLTCSILFYAIHQI